MNDKKISKFPIFMLFDRSSYMNSQIAKSFNTCVERLIFKLLANKQAQSTVLLGEIGFGKDAGIVYPLKPLFEFKLPGKLKPDKGPGTDLAAALHIANSEIEQEYNTCTGSFREGFRAGMVIFIAGRNTSSLASEILAMKKNSYMRPPVIFVYGKSYNEEALSKLSSNIYHVEDKIDYDGIVSELFKEEEKTSLINYEQNNNNTGYKEDSFQHQIDTVGSGGTLRLFPREFSGPSVIDRPMIIEGNNATVWALKGPVLRIESDGVILRNLKIEATGEAKGKSPEDECALFIEQGKSVALENVEVKGSVIGLPGEEGIWRYPHSLQLGRLQPRVEHDFIMKVAVPVPCKIISSISGIEMSPRSLSPGTHEVRIHIDSLPHDILISGKISVVSSLLKRDIFVNAHMMSSGGEALPGTSGQVIWEPDDWSTLALGPELQEKKEEETPEAPVVIETQTRGMRRPWTRVPPLAVMNRCRICLKMKRRWRAALNLQRGNLRILKKSLLQRVLKISRIRMRNL